MPMLRMLGHAEAAAGIEAIRAELAGRSDAAVAAVSDAYGELIALLRMDGAPVSAVQVAINKAYTAARLRRASRAVGDALREPRRRVQIGFYADRRYVGWAGGLPVVIDGIVAGAMGVSGMSQDLDEKMAGIGVAAICQVAA